MAAYMTAMAYGLAYITAATTIIMLNKYMLSVTAFHYPIVLSSMGVVCGWTLSLIGVHVTRTVDISNHKDITLASWAKNVCCRSDCFRGRRSCSGIWRFSPHAFVFANGQGVVAGGVVYRVVSYWIR